MCDYSLMGVPNRLAVEGEQLVMHRFPTGSLGLASPQDLEPAKPPREQCRSVWARLRLFLNPPVKPPVPAVCIPPGARLVMDDIPRALQRGLKVSPIELVTFTQITPPSGSVFSQFAASGSYRDAVRFRHGVEVRLQELREGQRMWVMDLSAVEPVQDGVVSNSWGPESREERLREGAPFS